MTKAGGTGGTGRKNIYLCRNMKLFNFFVIRLYNAFQGLINLRMQTAFLVCQQMPKLKTQTQKPEEGVCNNLH